jgi:hypothetical protein
LRFELQSTQSIRMQRLVIQCANWFLLIVILIGIPAITSARLGHLQLSSAPVAQKLTLWGSALVAAGNAMAAIVLLNGRRERLLAWKWAAIFAALLLTEFLFIHHYFSFDWLRAALVWLEEYL